MKLRLTAALAAIAAGALATSAMAEPVVAKLAAPGPGAAKPVAGGAVFECLGDVCAARTPSADTASVRGCKELARQMGAVNSFGPASRQLSPEQLGACNESAKK
ncbi:MAG TPA: hypothetical protein VJS38_04385 [Phenylobacterium sp.]|uniref:CC_3452 family protein n=1 Tax=Phenylobacterium sp. TaxID=1871053 RepID=UPI002B45F9E5|nr:hypothetical protein [Phenylobacterium sp.]HKR87388.1 hypothetical protein [Phenylobacterium sp.]